ncbi:MAG: endonuclease NucS [Bacillus sp. (in: Bacteria)]|nr:endonuclease NucS [Bacillus sp. (in: firmicutes)]
MDEMELKHAIMVQPELIEAELVFKDKEVYLNGKRCDLLFTDKDGLDVYVEVKLRVKDNAYGQIARYNTLVNNPEARFMVVGLSFQEGMKEALKKFGFEYCELNEEKVDSLLEKISWMVDAEVKKKLEEIRVEKEELAEGEERLLLIEERVNFLLQEVPIWRNVKRMG